MVFMQNSPLIKNEVLSNNNIIVEEILTLHDEYMGNW